MSVIDRYRLDGDTAIVTGGNRGIGYAISEGFAEVGANVVVANRDAESGEEAAEAIAETTSADTLAVPTDVRDTERVQEMVEITVDRFGDVDVLVNNAGIAVTTPAEEKALSEWQKTIDINLTGAYRCGKYAGQTMIDGDGGLIINISSMSAFIANFPQRHIDYQASKSGMEGLKAEMLQEEFADPEDIAPLAVYLASDASSYVTGTSVVIDGGYTVR
jgi:NAD(P)-dependent dehydrogenase (short-subunit alcohol dehydrogenase family)